MPNEVLAEATTEHLSVLLAQGDNEALAEAFTRWSGLVHTIALRSVGHQQDAQDVTQQAFISAWHSRHTLRPGPSALPAWLVGITRHCVLDLYEQRRRAVRNAGVVGDALEQVSLTFDDEVSDRVYLQYELERLGSPREEIVRMAVMEGRTHIEVADRLDLPVGTVKSHVRRGLRVLRERLEEVRCDPSG